MQFLLKFIDFLEKKVSVRIFLLAVFLSLFLGFVVNWLSVSGKSQFTRSLGNLPSNFKRVLTGVNSDLIIKSKFKNKKKGISVFNENLFSLHENGYLLVSRYVEDRSITELIHIKSKKILNTWEPNINKLIDMSNQSDELTNLRIDRNQSRFMILDPALLENGDLIFQHDSPIYKVDICSNYILMLDSYFHHSINVDENQNIWGLGRKLNRGFYDDTIKKASKDLKKIMFEKSVFDILVENNLDMYFASSYGFDPVHVNDVEIVKKDGKFWKKNDLFISIRNLSLIILYRPDENKVIWHKQGPWTAQHDVDVLYDKNSISIFDNNLDITKAEVVGSNDIKIFNFENGITSSPYKEGLLREKVTTIGGGVHRILTNGNLFIEESNNGRILMFSKNNDLIWEYINKADDGKLRSLGWSSYYNYDEIKKLLDKKYFKKCKN